MIRILPSFAAVLAACTPSPQEAAMPNASRELETAPKAIGGAARATPADARPQAEQRATREVAALGPATQPISAAENPLSMPPADATAEALGRRTLSTAFVRVGPDGLVTVELQGGRTLVLRNLVMHRRKFCGMPIASDRAGAEYCAGYAEVVAARPGGQPAPAPADMAAPHPLGPSQR